MTDHVNLLLIGFGSVARSFVNLLIQRATRLGLQWHIVGVATARHDCAMAPAGINGATLLRLADEGMSLAACHDASTGSVPANTMELLKRVAKWQQGHPEAARLTMVENTPLSLNGGQPGLDHVRAALELGADVITANKGPAAFAYRELLKQASASGSTFRFEGAVLDGLPVFSLLRETLPGAHVERVRGVVNTTTNHLLTAMEQGRSIDDAVADMQAAGIAEADPAMDVDGWDAAAKTAVLANVLLGAEITPHDVVREGLRALEPSAVQAARQAGGVIKLVASAERRRNDIVATVGPRVLDGCDPLAGLSGTAKGLVIETDVLGPLVITKQASDVTHTAYALMADLLSIHRQTNNPPT